MRRALALLGLSATAWIAWAAAVPSAAVAAVDGPCTATIDGVDVTTGHDDPGSAVPLRSGTRIPVAGTAEGRVSDLSYTVRVAGGGVQVGDVILAEDGRSWSGTVDLRDFSNATVGVFEVTADVQTDAGDCTGVAFVCIEGRSPLTTAAGAGATALGVGGAILLGLSLVRAGGLGAGRAAVQGFSGGATLGLGAAVLLQQFCVLPLSAAAAAGIPLGVGAAGAAGSSALRRLRMRTGRARVGPRGLTGGPGAEPTQVLERAGAPSAGAGGGPSPAPSAPAGGPGPAPSAPAGGPGPAPSAPAGGPGPAPSAPAGGPGPAPSAPGGGPGPAPSAPGGGPSPAPSAPGGGPSPAPSAPGGGPSPAPPMPEPPPTAGEATLPVIVPSRSDDEVVCGTCGTPNARDAQFCTNCGARLEP